MLVIAGDRLGFSLEQMLQTSGRQNNNSQQQSLCCKKFSELFVEHPGHRSCKSVGSRWISISSISKRHNVQMNDNHSTIQELARNAAAAGIMLLLVVLATFLVMLVI